MKNKHLLAAFIFGIIIVIMGAFLKIMHYEFGFITANLLLTMGMAIKIIAALLFITKLLGTNNEFLNK